MIGYVRIGDELTDEARAGGFRDGAHLEYLGEKDMSIYHAGISDLVVDDYDDALERLLPRVHLGRHYPASRSRSPVSARAPVPASSSRTGRTPVAPTRKARAKHVPTVAELKRIVAANGRKIRALEALSRQAAEAPSAEHHDHEQEIADKLEMDRVFQIAGERGVRMERGTSLTFATYNPRGNRLADALKRAERAQPAPARADRVAHESQLSRADELAFDAAFGSSGDARTGARREGGTSLVFDAAATAQAVQARLERARG